MKQLMVFGALALSLSALAADVHDVWSASAKPATLAGGAVAFTYDGSGNVSAVTATPTDGATIWLTGDKIPFAADASITVAAEGRLQLSNAVACAGNLSVVGSGEVEIEWNKGKKTFLPTNTFETMFADLNLDDWEPEAFHCERDENRPSPCSFPNCFNAAYYRRETVGGEKRMTVDLIAQGGGTATWRKFIRILLVQDGASVKGQVLNAWYAENSPKAADLIDEELLDPNSDVQTRWIMTKSGEAGGGYGVTQLTLRRVRPASVVRFDGAVTVPAANRISVAETATVEGLIGKVTNKVNVEANGVFEYRADTSDYSVYVSTVLTGSGKVSVCGSNPLTVKNNDSLFDDFLTDGYIGSSETWMSNDRFAGDITNIVAEFTGTEGSTVYSAPLPAGLYHLKPYDTTGSELVAQLQAVKGDVIKCAYVRFYNKGYGIYNYSLYGQFLSAWSLPNESPYSLGVDFDEYKDSATQLTIATTFSGSGLGVHNPRMYFAQPRPSRLMADGSSCTNKMNGSPKFVVGGSDVRAVRFMAIDMKSLPGVGTIDVQNGGELDMTPYQGSQGVGYSGGGAKIVVRKGGLIRQFAANPVGDNQKVLLDGGEMRTGYKQTITGDGVFFQFLTFRDGARVYGNPIRVGQRVAAPFYTVCGSEPSTLDADLVLAAASASTFQLRVGDVTGDAEADFVINGDISHSDANTYLAVAKYGPGTVRMNGCHRQKRPVEIHAGAWCLGKSGITNADANNPSDFVLCGGSLAAAADAVNTIGTLSINGTGTIAIASGAQLTVSTLDLSGATGTIVIDADLKADSFRIGNGTSPISQQTMHKFKQLVGGKLCNVHADVNGWVREGGYGMMIFLR